MTGEEGVYGTDSISSISSQTLTAGERKCYKTEIKNTGKLKAQTVSLYLSGVKSNDYANTYVGVNNPMKTHKHLQSNTGNKVINDINKKNVYVGFNTANDFNPADFSVHYWGNGVTPGNSDVAYQFRHNTDDNGIYIEKFKFTYHIYHAEIPYDATCVKPRSKNSENYYGVDNKEVDNKNLIGIFRDSSGINADYASTGKGAGIKQFYSLATVSVGQKIDLSAIAQGKSISYTVEDTTKATVDNSGVVTGKAFGQTKLTLTATGDHGDTQTAECTLIITDDTIESNSVPVVTNMVTYPYNEKTKENLVTVYWYIKNEGSSDITFSVDKINLTL